MCKKEVLDFTQLTDKELIHRLDTNKKMCGRFREDQLNVDLHSMDTLSLPYKKWWLSAASIFSLGLLGQAQEVETVSNPNVEQIQSQEKSIESKTYSLNTYKGIVVDTDGFPITDAYVYLVGDEENGKYTNGDGLFVIEGFENDTINVEFLGFETRSLMLKDIKNDNYITLGLGENVLIEEVVVGGAFVKCKPGVLQRFLNLFRSGENKRCFRKQNH